MRPLPICFFLCFLSDLVTKCGVTGVTGVKGMYALYGVCGTPVMGVFAVPRPRPSCCFFRSRNVVFTGAGEARGLSWKATRNGRGFDPVVLLVPGRCADGRVRFLLEGAGLAGSPLAIEEMLEDDGLRPGPGSWSDRFGSLRGGDPSRD